jgi:MoxR-like ATPase
VTTEDLGRLSAQIARVDLTAVLEPYMELALKIRDLGIAFSDRRAVKVLKLVSASALICGRMHPAPSDLWVLRYCWDREEQIEPLASLVNGFLERQARESERHPLAAVPNLPSAEDLARQLEVLEKQVQDKNLSLTALARLKESLAGLADQAAWLQDARSRQFLLDKTRQCLERIG